MPSRSHTILLDGRVIRKRALSRGLSLLGLSERCGMSPPTLQRIIDGKKHPDLRLSQVVRLADDLDTTIGGLLHQPNPQPMASDAVRVEATLLTARRRLTLSQLRAVLGWDKRRTLAALADLAAALTSTGAQLNRSSGLYSIGPRDGVLDPAAKKRVKTVRDGRSELELGEARMLRRVAAGQITDRRMPRNIGGAARAQLGALLEHELIVERGRGFALTPEVEFSLGLRVRPLKPRGGKTTPAATATATALEDASDRKV